MGGGRGIKGDACVRAYVMQGGGGGGRCMGGRGVKKGGMPVCRQVNEGAEGSQGPAA